MRLQWHSMYLYSITVCDSFKVVVVSGAKSTDIGTNGREDHIYEQMMPLTSNDDSQVYDIPLNGNRVRIMAIRDNTQVHLFASISCFISHFLISRH